MPATITVPVTSFVAAGSGFCATGALTVSDPSGRVTVDPTNSNNIRVSNPGRAGAISLQFNVTPTVSNFKVCGLAITNNGLNNPNPGNADFTINQINGNSLTIVDRYNRGSGTIWKLFIAVVNSAGQVGIIDPGIDNTDEA